MYIFLLFFYSLDYLHSLVSVEEYSASFFPPGIAMAFVVIQVLFPVPLLALDSP